MDSQSDPDREEKRRLADLLAGHLNAAALEQSYDRLILVAPAKTLGDLRQALSKEAAARIGGELTKDLTKVADRDRSEEHTSELQSLMRNSYAVFCLKKKIVRLNREKQ